MTENNNDENLSYLHDLSDYKVADDYPDVRGWDLKDSGDRTVGKVDGLLVNKNEKRVVYLEIEVDAEIIENGLRNFDDKTSGGVHEFENKDGETHLIVPIGLVVLDEENETAKAEGINYDTFANTRRYKKSAGFKRDYELIVISGYLPTDNQDTSTAHDNSFYNHAAFGHNTGEK